MIVTACFALLVQAQNGYMAEPESEPVSYVQASYTNVATPANTCGQCRTPTPCIDSTGGCVALECHSEPEYRNNYFVLPPTTSYAQGVPQRVAGNKKCSCPSETNHWKCLQPTNESPFMVGFVLAVIHLGLVFKTSSATLKEYNVVSVLVGCVLLIDTLGYLVMSGGYGSMVRCCDGRMFYPARYIAWAFGTTIMVWILCFLTKSKIATTVQLMITNILMIVSGGIASGVCGWMKWALFGFSVFCFLPLLWFITTKFSSGAVGSLENDTHKFLRSFAVIWTLYPVIWIFGTGTGKVCVFWTTTSYTILDIAAKSSFGHLARKAAVRDSDQLMPSEETFGETDDINPGSKL